MAGAVLVLLLVAAVYISCVYGCGLQNVTQITVCNDEESNTTKCCTLNQVADAYSESSGPIKITITFVTVSEVVLFHDFGHVKISGEGNGLNIKCNNPGRLSFTNVQNLHLKSLVVQGCGDEDHQNQDPPPAAIYIYNCSNVTLQDIHIYGKTMALALHNNYGHIKVEKLSIKKNVIDEIDFLSRPAGIYIKLDFSMCNSSALIRYSLKDCTISDSRAEGVGGGMGVFFFDCTHLVNITITNCNFTGNKARWGGGLHLRFSGYSNNNTVTIENCSFTNNSANKGGGGVDIVYNNDLVEPSSTSANRVYLKHTFFSSNHAKFGGGMMLHSQHFERPFPDNIIEITNCNWTNNTADMYGASVDISPYYPLLKGFLPMPNFKDCTFDGETEGSQSANIGSFIITDFQVYFEGIIMFRNHKHSALHVASGTVILKEKTNMLFLNNTGFRGGALALYGFSSIRLYDRVHLNFINNTATDRGGAIYHHSFDHHDSISSNYSCFIQYVGNTVGATNIVVNFENNIARSGRGNVIFAVSLNPCTENQEMSINDTFKKIGKFDFTKNPSGIATSGSQYYNTISAVDITAGEKQKLNISMRDELRNKVSPNPIFRVFVREEKSTIKIDRSYTSNNKVRFKCGKPNDTAVLEVHEAFFRELSTTIKVHVDPCPLGYTDVENNEKCTECVCSADQPDKSHMYMGIKECNSTMRRAYIQGGFWIGFNETSSDLWTAPCPWGFCQEDKVLLPIRLHDLNASFVCRYNHKGALCGECSNGNSAYFHDPLYRCGPKDQCRLSTLFIVLSEFLPMILLFTVIVVFNVRLTTGKVNGFIFFCQIIDTLSINGRGVTTLPSLVEKLSLVYQIIYGFFNLEFFSIEPLHFCLWRSAKIMDTLTIKFAIITLAFLTVIALEVIMKYCSCYQLDVIRRTQSTTTSFMNGLSAFLIVCYTQCIKVSFQILTPATIRGEGGKLIKIVSFYQGEDYFSKGHWYYAAAAIFFLSIVVVTPLLLILIHSAYHGLLYLLGQNEIRFLGKHIKRFQPFLNSFESCFKDNLRIFAGLYLIYRIIILSLYAFCKSLDQVYVLLEFVTIMMLVVHSIFQPYRRQSHNVVDSLIYANIAAINAITLYIRLYYPNRNNTTVFTDALSWIQMILIYLPLLIICLYFVKRFIQLKTDNREINSYRLDTEASYVDPPDIYIDHNDIPYQDFPLTDLPQNNSTHHYEN